MLSVLHEITTVRVKRECFLSVHSIILTGIRAHWNIRRLLITFGYVCIIYHACILYDATPYTRLAGNTRRHMCPQQKICYLLFIHKTQRLVELVYRVWLHIFVIYIYICIYIHIFNHNIYIHKYVFTWYV